MSLMPGSGPMPGTRPAGVSAITPPRKLGDLLVDEVFWYIATFTFTALQNTTLTIPIQSDAHFVCVATYMNCSVATGGANFQGAGVNRGGSVVQITDGGTQRALQSAQCPADTLFGSAQRPLVWPMRKIFRANTQIQLNITDTTNAGQTTDYVFGGFKVPLGSVPMLNNAGQIIGQYLP